MRTLGLDQKEGTADGQLNLQIKHTRQGKTSLIRQNVFLSIDAALQTVQNQAIVCMYFK